MSLYNMVKACSLGHPDYCTLKKADYHFSVEREREGRQELLARNRRSDIE